MRRLAVLGVVITLLLATLAAPLPAAAAGYSLTYSGFSGTCSASGFTTATTATYDLATDVGVVGSTTLDGAAYDTFGFGLSAGQGAFATAFSRTFSPALASSTYSFVFRSDLQVAGASVGTTTTTISCNAGAFSASSTFAVATAAFVGPGIPSGFVLRAIACNTAVFDRPGGQAVGSNRILAGQTWYVNPKPSDPDADGRRWTEIFVSSFVNGYVPAECVGGQEALAPAVVYGLPSGSFGLVSGTVGIGTATGGTAVLTGGANGTVSVNPAGQTVYTVAIGDRLYRIALKFGVSVTALATANGISNFNLIYPGQQLIIPG